VQVSRLGHPLVNEVVIGLADKDRFNATKPTGDTAFLSYVVDPELPKLFQALYGIPAPPAPRNDLVTVFLTGIPGLNKPANPNQVPCEMLRLNMAIPPAAKPSRFGVIAGDIAGFPNGRRLADDVVDIEERVAAGILVEGFDAAPANQLGDGVDANDRPFLPRFPYVAPPNNPLDNAHYAEQKGGSTAAAAGQRILSSAVSRGKLALAASNPSHRHVLAYSVPQAAHVTLAIYNVQGRMVRTLVDQDAAAGQFDAVWDGRADDGTAVAKGVYFARYATDGQRADERKLILE
jgi:hypothetical protein